jgi:hypothetical protein
MIKQIKIYNRASFGREKLCSVYPEMEFLDINLTKDTSLLRHAIHSPVYWRILKKTIFYSGFKNCSKCIQKICEIGEHKYINE